MPELGNDTSYAVLIISMILASFGVFLIAIVTIFYKRAINRRAKINQLEMDRSQDLLKSALDAQEKERRRIGADIHDDIGPSLSLLKLQLARLEKITTNTKAIDMLAESRKTIDGIIKNVRQVSRDLAPAVLFELGVEEAISQLKERLIELTDAKVTFEIECPLAEITPSQALAIYRILQEGLNNVLKHSEASEIYVSIHERKGMISTTIKDNGIGFCATDLTDGFGLSNLNARAKMFGGNLDYTSIEGQGTTLKITMKKDNHDN